ncbi:primosomal protein N' [bacterium]|nr:MAG: primosomal protein N' [bacterium]
MIYADIALPTPIRAPFTYEIPESLKASVQIGVRVHVPFGPRYAIGLVDKIHDVKPTFDTKQIKEVLDTQPLFSKELLKLAEWVSNYYFCSKGEVYQAMLPVGLNYQSIRFIRLLDSQSSLVHTQFLARLSEKEKFLLKDILAEFRDISTSELNELSESGIIEIWDEPKIKATQVKERVWNWVESSSNEKAKTYLSEQKKLAQWHAALQELLLLDLPATTSQLQSELISAAHLKRIEKQGFIKVDERIKEYKDEHYAHQPENIRSLNAEQFKAYETIKESVIHQKYEPFLLKGVTGSGKTEVYIHAIKTSLELGKGAILLVPEIALTPQTVRRFYEIFGDEIAVLHSRLSDAERLFAWNELKSGNKRIVIGPRSAVFAPVRNPGIIIVDEEHDNSYKQEDPAPRYHGRETAITRAFLENCPVVLGSATPALTTWNQAKEGKIRLLELNERHAGATLPEVEILDLSKYRNAMRGPLAIPVFQAIDEALKKDEQAIILLNRRGFAPHLLCTSCGSIQECPNCSVSLTYHKPSRAFRCHYCGYGRFETSACSSCGNPELEKVGFGTQRIEEEIVALFPDVKVLRMDQDTTRGKYSHRELTEAFRKKEAHLLIGTQLVSKGLDFPDVTVVGVINTDTELAFPSYKSHERMFQLLSQVAGRSGRGQKKGVVYFQTWKPGKMALTAAKVHDYELFAETELLHRKEAEYPPYSKLVNITFKGKNKDEVGKAAQLYHQCVSELASKWPVLGPAPSTIEKIDREFYWELTLKMHPNIKTNGIAQLLEAVTNLYDERRSSNYGAIRVIVRVDA